MKGAKLLKVVGILMIIGGAIGIIMGIIAVAGVSVLAALAGPEFKSGLYIFAAILLLVGAVLELVAGIIGVKDAKVPEKANTCLVWGIIVAVLSVLSNILTVAAGGDFSVVSLITGLVLPVLFIIGAVLNKKPVQE